MKHPFLPTFFASVASITLVLIVVSGAIPSIAAPAPFEPVTYQHPASALQMALDEADRVVRVRVLQSAGAWTPDRSAINSTNRVSVRYTLRGPESSELIVKTVGGYVPAEDLYMISPDLPTLSGGEEAILFLAQSGDGYAIAGGQNGKFVVRAGLVVYAGALFEEPIADFYARLQALDPTLILPAEWPEQEAKLAQEPVVDGMDFVYKNIKWPTSEVGFKVNLNSRWIDTEAGSASDFLAALRNAAKAWSMVDGADFTLTYVGETDSTAVANNRVNEIFFENRGLVDDSGKSLPLAVATVFFSNGAIIDSDIWINDAYDWDATGDPAWREIDLESVVLHEMGHWLALGHDPDVRAVMYYSIMSGTLKRTLFDNDRRGIEFIYTCPTDNLPCNPSPAPTSTATPTATPTPTVTPTPTIVPTPTAIAKKVSVDGGTLDFVPSNDGEVNLVVPPNAVLTDTLVSIQRVDTEPAAPANFHPLMDSFRMVVQLNGVVQDEYTFAIPITMTVAYDGQPGGMSTARAVALYELNVDEERWEEPECGPVQHDAPQQTVTVPVCHPSIFGLFAEDSTLFLPVVQR